MMPYQPGERVLVNGAPATIRACFPEAYCLVDFGRSAREQALSTSQETDGDCGVKVPLSQVSRV